VIDACTYLNPAGENELAAYLSEGWRELLGYGRVAISDRIAPSRLLPARPYPRPAPDAEVGKARYDGSDPSRTISEHLDAEHVDASILVHDSAASAPGNPSSRLATALVSACNEWTADTWLSADDRFYGTLLVPTQVPERAASEMARFKDNPRFVGVHLSANTLSRPFGHEIYDPIHRAAAEYGMALILTPGGEATTDTQSGAVAGGAPSTYTDYAVNASQAVATHLVSLAAQGVLERYPGISVLVLGTGITWLIPLLWRFATEYKALHRSAPWLAASPVDGILERVRVGTHPLTRPVEHGALARYLNAMPELADVICYASGYPSLDTTPAETVIAEIPSDWLPNVMENNAAAVLARSSGGLQHAV
jgi:predicted TIM-barrel fold metal-dependent hydrolase